jgi:hypothetical protein
MLKRPAIALRKTSAIHRGYFPFLEFNLLVKRRGYCGLDHRSLVWTSFKMRSCLFAAILSNAFGKGRRKARALPQFPGDF